MIGVIAQFVVTGLVFVILAIPMALRKVRPNRWYGFRTPKTLSSPEIWYAANAAMGRDLMIAGAGIVVFVLVSALVLPDRAPLLRLVNTGVLVFALAVCLLRGFLHLRRL
jgi:uncharacterized membrane protein